MGGQSVCVFVNYSLFNMSKQWSFVFEESEGTSPTQPIPQKQHTTDGEISQSSCQTPETTYDANKGTTAPSTKNTKWNFTGARLKPHVVGVHFDKHSQYLGNWKGESKSSKPLNDYGIQIRPTKQIQRSFKKISKRTSAPSQYHSKLEPTRSGSLCTSNPKAKRNSQHSTELPHLGDLNFPPRGREQNYDQLYQLQSSRTESQVSYAPEPLYRSTSMPQYPGAEARDRLVIPMNELTNLADHQYPSYSVSGRQSMPRIRNHEPAGIQRHSSLVESTRSSIQLGEFGELVNPQSQEEHIEPTYVYFSEESTHQVNYNESHRSSHENISRIYPSQSPYPIQLNLDGYLPQNDYQTTPPSTRGHSWQVPAYHQA